ncbi:MAG: hypothetical protein U9R03_02445, partial [Candidatus Aerophobetes bacterium]|nr:hypothetical protein [Candidatus Aerophobetes bacterium]
YLRNIGFANETLKKAKKLLPPDKIKEAKRNLYNTVEDLAGFNDPTSTRQARKNIWGTISGGTTQSPKSGFFQQKVTRKRQTLTGRSVITPNPSLDIDEVEIPYSMGFDMYEPYIKKEFYARGYNKDETKSNIKKQTNIAKEILRTVGKERPIMLNRAPSIWQGSVTGNKPIFTDSKNIGIPNLLAPFILGDFDGDAVSIHVPVSQDAIKDTKNMMPSKHMTTEETGKIVTYPDQSAMTGLYLLSKNPMGREKINNILPSEFHINKIINKNDVKDIIKNIVLSKKYNIAKIIDKLRDLGDNHAYSEGFSFGLSDIAPLKKLQQEAFSESKRLINQLPPEKRTSKYLKNIYTDVIKDTTGKLENYLKQNQSPLSDMFLSKARGRASQYRDMLISPISVDSGELSEEPTRHSYAEGLTPSEYWDSAKGARLGVLGRSQEMAKPGALGKEVLATMNTLVISNTKNDNMKTIDLSLDNSDDLVDRFLGKDIKDSKGNILFKKNSLINPKLIQKAKKYNLSTLPVYTPLGSSNIDGGLPSMSYGLNKDGQLPDIGTNIGAQSSFGLIEPLYTQGLSSFHTGSNLDAESTGYPRLKQILELTKKLPNEGTLSTIDGTVEEISKDALGGHNVTINKKVFYILPSNVVKVKVGDKISQGDILSGGPIQPKKIAELKTLGDAQNYMVEEVRKNVPDMKRRAIETVVEGITRHARIIDPGDTDYLPGDVDLINNINEKNKQVKKPAIIEYLFKGVNTLPQATQTWLSKLNFRNLTKQFSQDIAMGAETNIHSY